jgi:hypothetical protein
MPARVEQYRVPNQRHNRHKLHRLHRPPPRPPRRQGQKLNIKSSSVLMCTPSGIVSTVQRVLPSKSHMSTSTTASKLQYFLFTAKPNHSSTCPTNNHSTKSSLVMTSIFQMNWRDCMTLTRDRSRTSSSCLRLRLTCSSDRRLVQ